MEKDILISLSKTVTVNVQRKAALKCQNCIKKILNPYTVWHSKDGNRLRILSPAPEMRFLLVFLKYKEIDVRIQTFVIVCLH